MYPVAGVPFSLLQFWTQPAEAGTRWAALMLLSLHRSTSVLPVEIRVQENSEYEPRLSPRVQPVRVV